MPDVSVVYEGLYTAVQPWARRTHDNLMYEVEGGIKFLTQDAAMRERLRREWNRPLLWPAYVLGALCLGFFIAFIRVVRRSKNATS